MNATQRKRIQKAINHMADARVILEEVKQEMEDALEEKSDAWKEGEMGGREQTLIDAIGDAMDYAESGENTAEDALTDYDNA